MMAFAVALCLIATTAMAQPAAEETNGQVTLPDNSTQSGMIKDNIRKKGEFVLTSDGKKTKFKAADISSVKLGNAEYISRNNTFYEVIWEGSTLCLLRKASEASGVQYNGSEAVMISSEGKIDDYFLKKNASSSFELITKKNVQDVLKKLCATCTATVSSFDAAGLRSALEGCECK